jgi:putative ABC transport system permease protein
MALLGIIIGVAAVIVMIAIGHGAQRAVLQRIENMGNNLLVVNAGKVKNIVGRRRQIGNVITLKLEDAEAILESCPSVEQAAPTQEKMMKVKYGNMTTSTKILGTTPEFQSIRNFAIQEGQFFNARENRASQRIAVLGSIVHENLFYGEDPVGEMLRIGSIPFEVVGVMKSKGISPEGANEDNQIIIPLRTALRRVMNINYLNSIFVQIRNQEAMERGESEIRELLRERHRLNRRNKPDDFTIQNQMNLIRAERATTASFTLLIGSIAGISLLVGGVGILAVMLLSVKERTSEIGLRMATGARPRDILVQFLWEALILGISGGLMGIIAGLLSALIIGLVTTWKTVVTPESIVLSTIFSLATGLIFGVYPAKRAARLDPIVALSSE